MTREEMIKSFANVPGRCKRQCPYVDKCNFGNFCVFKEAALVMSRDAAKINNLEHQLDIMSSFAKLLNNYIVHLEDICHRYYDMIHDYNGGVVKKLYIPGRRKRATKVKPKRPKMNAKKARDGVYDGDPLYEQKDLNKETYDIEELI